MPAVQPFIDQFLVAQDYHSARSALGLVIGVDVLRHTEGIESIAAIAVTSGMFIVGQDGRWSGVTAESARESLGLKKLATLDSVNNQDWEGESLEIKNGGTGATTPRTARESLELTPGKDVQEFDENLKNIADAVPSKNAMLVGNGNGWVTAEGLEARRSLGLGTLAEQNSVDGSVWEGEALDIRNGGTGAKDASDARTSLGLTIGKDVQGFSKSLESIAAIESENNTFVVSHRGEWIGIKSEEARLSLGLGPLATEKTVDDECWGAIPLAVDNGGTGSADLTQARSNLGLAINKDIQGYSKSIENISKLESSFGSVIVGSGTDWASVSGEQARKALGLEIGKDVQGYDAKFEGAIESALKTSSTVQSLISSAVGKNIQGHSERLDEISNLELIDGNMIACKEGQWVSVDEGQARGALGLSEIATAKTPDGDLVGTTHKQALKNKRISFKDNHVLDIPAEVVIEGTTTIRMPFAMNLTAIRASLVKEGKGMRISVTKAVGRILDGTLCIGSGKRTSVGEAQPKIVDPKLDDDCEVTVNVERGHQSEGLRVVLIGTRE